MEENEVTVILGLYYRKGLDPIRLERAILHGAVRWFAAYVPDQTAYRIGIYAESEVRAFVRSMLIRLTPKVVNDE